MVKIGDRVDALQWSATVGGPVPVRGTVVRLADHLAVISYEVHDGTWDSCCVPAITCKVIDERHED